MLKVGITGGIGSGKSVVCRIFLTLGIPVFSADDAARYLQEHDSVLRQQIIDIIGAEAYNGAIPDRNFIAAAVFNNPLLLQQLNAVVHPATIQFGEAWLASQKTAYAIKEAAIFFESGSNHTMDVMVGVYAPREVRLTRAMQRGGASREKIESIMARQMDDDEKMSMCDYVVTNDDKLPLIPQILQLHKTLLEGSRKI